MRAVDVGVGHDDDLAVAQVVEHRVRRLGRVRDRCRAPRRCRGPRCWRRARGGDLEGVQHLALQRQDRLVLAVAGLLGRAARPNRPRPGRPRCESCPAISQSVSLPGSTATPEPLRFSTTLPAFWRAVAALMASCAIFLPSSTFGLSQASSGSFTREAISFTASRDDRRSLVWPWNCGIEDARREHVAQRLPDVLGLQAHAARERARGARRTPSPTRTRRCAGPPRACRRAPWG